MNKFLAFLLVGTFTAHAQQQESRPVSPTDTTQVAGTGQVDLFAALAEALKPEAEKTEAQRMQDWQREREEHRRLQKEIYEKEQKLLKAQEKLRKTQQLLALRKWAKTKGDKVRADFKGELANVEIMAPIEE